MNEHSIAERGAGLFVCTCGEEVPVFGTTRSSYSRAFWSHIRDVVTSTGSTTEGGR